MNDKLLTPEQLELRNKQKRILAMKNKLAEHDAKNAMYDSLLGFPVVVDNSLVDTNPPTFSRPEPASIDTTCIGDTTSSSCTSNE